MIKIEHFIVPIGVIMIIAICIIGGLNSTEEKIPAIKYQLENGTIVACRGYRRYQGPISLFDCEDGSEYLSQVNVKRLK